MTVSFELKCPVCKSDSFLNPNIKIFISPCFHKICEHCLYKIFAHGYAPCPECKTQLRRINFITSTFEDVEVERELKIRKQLAKVFQSQLEIINQEDVELEDKEIIRRNDWLEEYENLIFELMELKSEALIKSKIKEILNSDSILNNIFKGESVEIISEPELIEEEDEVRFGVYEDSNNTLEIPDVDIPSILFKIQKDVGVSKNMVLTYILNETSKYF